MENKNQSYEEIFKRQPDFRVTYRLFDKEEGGRYSLPTQGIRFNFWYDHPENKKNEFFMIFPEFENEICEILTNGTTINKKGTARMWIISNEFIEYHRKKIKNGTVGYFMEGLRKVGECEVIELINLK